MASRVWVDGVVTDKLTATISPLDHGLLFGDGVAVGTRIYGGVAFRLDQYLGYLAAAAGGIGLKLPLTAAEFSAAVAATVAASGRADGYVKVVVTRGAGALGFDPRKCEPAVVIVVDDLLPYPPELREAGVSVVTARRVRRHRGHVADSGFTLSNVAAVVATREALDAGCLDALVLDETGAVTGTTAGAVFALSGGGLRTGPAADGPDPVFAGVVAELATLHGLTVAEHAMTPDDVAGADEAFFAGGGSEIVGVTHVDGVRVGGGTQGSVTRALRARFADLTGARPPG